jgi:hypothetical protein
MAAPLKNKNHLKYPPIEVKRLFNEGIMKLKNDEKIFNYPCLHRSIGLKTLRTLPYLAEKYRDDKEIKNLWNQLLNELSKNQDIHINEIEFVRLFWSPTRAREEIAPIPRIVFSFES